MRISIPDSVQRRVKGHFERTFARAMAYASEGRVHVVRSEWPVVARVQGGAGHVVTVHYTRANRYLRGDCSCSDATDCEHAAAAVLVALAQARRLAEARLEHEAEVAVGSWLAQLTVAPDGAPAARGPRQVVAYVLAPADTTGGLALTIHAATARRRGGLGASSVLGALGDPARGAPPWVGVDDLRRIALLRAVSRAAPRETALRLDRVDAALLCELATTGRLFWERTDSQPLLPGPPRRGALVWRERADAPGRFGAGLDDDLLLVAGQDVCYIDLAACALGPLDVGAPAALVQRLVHAPPIPGSMLPAVRRSLRPLLAGEVADGLAPADAIEDDGTGVARAQPVPYLSVSLAADGDGRSYIDARAEAVYGEERYELAVWTPGRPAPRDMTEEGRLRRRLDTLLRGATVTCLPGASPEVLAELRAVAHRIVPALAEEGWICSIDPDLAVERVTAPGDWVESLRPRANLQWFSLELGVVIAGRTVPLLPILLEAIRSGALPLDPEELASQPVPGTTLRLPDGELVYVPAERLRRWMAPLLELRLRGLSSDDVLEVPAYAAARFHLPAPGRFSGDAALAELRDRFDGLLALAPRSEPASFAGALRPYQREGLAWLRWLHEAGYGGLLADDMGLGKTVQLLAFLEELRAEGGLDAAPALVVAPRTVVGHWRDEAQRFAPGLRPLVHLGQGRGRRPEDLRTAPLVVTSYQTLLRDVDLFAALGFSTALYDEAQALKNPDTTLRRAIAAVPARSRFAVTGTPIENHLRELWSLMDLVMPGLLGRRTTFDGVFRRPIEKYGSDRALGLLRQRIRPFLLRRTKRAVALDLPPKTEIVELIELEATQRDLYESLRLSLDRAVRKALAARGVHGAQMVVLDALLKLRQCCCDPRLAAVPEAAEVTASAKLDRLVTMLAELVAAGRFTLVFSQFTSMLRLIGEACRDAEIPFLELTGKTRDRDGVVRAFQAGRAPVLLVSLKTGGAGLNLHRADTVIHYDPWWNPAAEDQATDRAHRIGQDQPVFVYKLVAKGTLEERILELQRAKRTLTTAALAGGGASELAAADIAALYHQLV
jgi:superfamily II DNA or RNA helicase